MYRRITALAGCVVLALAALAPAAGHADMARRIAAAEACSIPQGSVSADGGHRLQTPTVEGMRSAWLTKGVFPRPQEVRLSARQTIEPSIAGSDRRGYVVIDDALYSMSYWAPNGDGSIDPEQPPSLLRIGGGWAYFNFLETSFYVSPDNVKPTLYRSAVYGLKNGVLFRWSIDHATGQWRATGSYAGFSAVKSMALIAKTPTYDTFIANTRGGALYTIRIPSANPLKPIVKPIRTRTWQGFETLSAAPCGQYGTLLMGIDKDTKYAFLYAVGHANGLSTVIKPYGRIGYLWDDPLYFRWTPVPAYDIANGD